MKQRLTKLKELLCTIFSVLIIGTTVYAASNGATFVVNNVKIKASLSYIDTNDKNPIDTDSVTASTKANAAMDSIITTAKIYFADGDTLKTKTVKEYGTNCTKVTATARENLLSVGYMGKGTHYASHNKKSNSVNTVVYW